MQGGKNRSEDRPLLKNRAAGLRRPALQDRDAGLPDTDRRDPHKPGESPALQEREADPSTALGMTTEGERRAGTMYRAPTPRPCMSFAARRLWPPKGVCKPRNGCANWTDGSRAGVRG